MQLTMLSAQVNRSVRVAVGMASSYVLRAASEVARELGRCVIVLASRRQVEGVDGLTGYTGLSTVEWAKAASELSAIGPLVLARDHGGPYQHPTDSLVEMNEDTAMERAKRSLRLDIECGVQLLHIDTSLSPFGGRAPKETALSRAVTLAEYCASVARNVGREIGLEIGYEVQSDRAADPSSFGREAREIVDAIRFHCGLTPYFFVAQTATLVSGRLNSGRIREHAERTRVVAIARILDSLGVRLKAHNCDYLEIAFRRYLTSLGAWINISPEVGVAQTAAVLQAARRVGEIAAADEFSRAVVASGMWRRWSSHEDIPDSEKVLLGGSYMFNSDAFFEFSSRLDPALAREGASTERVVVDAIKSTVLESI